MNSLTASAEIWTRDKLSCPNLVRHRGMFVSTTNEKFLIRNKSCLPWRLTVSPGGGEDGSPKECVDG